MPEADDPKTGSTEGDGFYRRWSRRKGLSRATVEASAAQPAAPAPAPAPATVPAPDADATTQVERVLTDADMPDLDSLGEGDDFSPFMSPGVSEALRRKALRKLFLGSAFNVTDGLDDYDDDFTTFEALGDLITSDMRHRMEREAERDAQRAGARSEDATAADPGEARAPNGTVEEARDEAAGADEASSDPVAPGGAEADASPVSQETAGAPTEEAVPAVTTACAPGGAAVEGAAGDAEREERRGGD
jgi:hypothetical protein